MCKVKDVLRCAVPCSIVSIFLCVFIFSASSPVRGAEQAESVWSESPEVEIAADIYSMYVWRGVREVNGGVLQTTALMSLGGVYAEYWGNMDLTDSGGGSGDFTEVNLALGYEAAFLDMGILYYAFPNSDAPSTSELYVAGTAPVLLEPTLTLYQDVDESWGRYASLEIGHMFEDVVDLPGQVPLSVDLSAGIGYGDSRHNEDIYGRDSSAFTDAIYSVAFPVLLPNGFELSPSVSYTTVLDSRLRSEMENKDNVFAGISLSYSF